MLVMWIVSYHLPPEQQSWEASPDYLTHKQLHFKHLFICISIQRHRLSWELFSTHDFHVFCSWHFTILVTISQTITKILIWASQLSCSVCSLLAAPKDWTDMIYFTTFIIYFTTIHVFQTNDKTQQPFFMQINIVNVFHCILIVL